MSLTRSQLAAYVDHTLLRADASAHDVEAAVAEAAELGAYAICVSPEMLPLAAPASLRVVTVCGFPTGQDGSEAKASQAASAFWAGAGELDMVIDLAAAHAGDFDAVQADVAAVRAEVPEGRILKVIIESASLTDEQIAGTCRAAEWAGADFIKTSTGMHPAGGATIHAVSLIAECVGGRMGIKASGGIRTATEALAMIAAGATRLGLSQTRAVLDGLDAADRLQT